VKEELCYTALDYEEELVTASCYDNRSRTYELPDGNVVTLDSEQFQVPECLFQPSMIGKHHSVIVLKK